VVGSPGDPTTRNVETAGGDEMKRLDISTVKLERATSSSQGEISFSSKHVRVRYQFADNDDLFCSEGDSTLEVWHNNSKLDLGEQEELVREAFGSKFDSVSPKKLRSVAELIDSFAGAQ
jgi:hypothetical protein